MEAAKRCVAMETMRVLKESYVFDIF